MTPCEKLGYKVGDKFEVVGDELEGARKGDILTLIYDDSTSIPQFSGVGFEGGESFYYLTDLKKIGDKLPSEDSQTDEWITWSGGECPVPVGTLVDVMHRDGNYYFNQAACKDKRVECWSHEDHIGDITAYRLPDALKITTALKDNGFKQG